MFALIKFSNGELFITRCEVLNKTGESECTIKLKGAKYYAEILEKNDDKEALNIKKKQYLDAEQSEVESGCKKIDNLYSKRRSLTSSSTEKKKSTSKLSHEVHKKQKKSSNIKKEKRTYSETGNDTKCSIQSKSRTERFGSVSKEYFNNESESHDISACAENVIDFSAAHEETINPVIPNTKYVSSCSSKKCSPYENKIEKSFCTETSIISTIDDSNNLTHNYSSDYVPSSFLESTQNETENNIFVENCVDVIQANIDVNYLTVQYSGEKSKKHFCIFCQTLQTKFARHLFLKHKNESEVSMAFNLPKKSTERFKLIEKIRKKGDFLHNTDKDLNSGNLIVSRRQLKKMKNTVDEYMACKYCKGFFSKATLRVHRKKCTTAAKKGERNNFISSREMTQYIHEAACKVLKTKIFPVLRNDPEVKIIRYDDLIIKFGNALCERHHISHQHDLIRQNLRLLGRFKLEIIKLLPNVTQLSEVFRPQYHDKCIKAVRVVSKFDETTMGFATPTVATNLTTLIKKCAEKLRAEYIKTQSYDLKQNVEDFIILWNEETPMLNKKATDDLITKKRNKKTILPSKEDIKTLYSFLKMNCLKFLNKLQHRFSATAYLGLTENILIFIQLFNRRRAGEIERLTLANFNSRTKITDDIEDQLVKNMSQDSILFAKQFCRLTLRGKLGRTVSVLLNPLCTRSIKTLIKYRELANISPGNEFIFANPKAQDSFSKPYIRACPLLRRFAEQSGANMPESLRGTTLRKHIATYTSLLDVEEASVERLANFLGHHKDIHKEIYRVSVPVAEITCISKLLMDAVGANEADNAGSDQEKEVEDEIEIPNAIINDSAKELEDSVATKRKKRSTSPYGKTKRTRWTDQEKEAIHKTFGDLDELLKLPSLSECWNAIRDNTVLKDRTPQQVKTWIDNQRRYKINTSNTVNQSI